MVAKVLLSLVFFGLVACGGHTRAPIEDRNAESPHLVYSVNKGDTLYSIAFRYGLDFRSVAAVNGITAPYVIYPGQTINLGQQTSPQVAAGPLVMPAQGSAPVIQTPPASESALSLVPASDVSVAVMPAPSTATQAKSAVAKPVATASPVPTASQPKPKVYVGATVTTWLWPASGSVTRRYSKNTHNGIDIDGNRGEPIVAVAAGKVVYAGTGIVGFGELLIIKHNDVYLSAYGHNDRVLVEEGQAVSAGEIIAEKGSSGTDTVKLHFEIRKEGKPIDPQRVLPRR
ncbi:MAG: peptidoglycan DD-metalloendopeptidase family protein [Halioglobus sp.]|nr:peptidoglycan DD-metalloendopeptidase family protein [Halioglobus sp.]